MNYRYCPGCGHGFGRTAWEAASFCNWCGVPLKSGTRRGGQANAFPRPDRVGNASRAPGAFTDALEGVGTLMHQHPLIVSAGAIAAGLGGVMTGMWLAGLGHGLAVAGCVLVGLGLIAGFSKDNEGAGGLILGGLFLLMAGALTVLIGNVLFIAGMVSTAAGIGVGVKTAVEAAARRRVEQAIKTRSLTDSVNALVQLNT